MGSAAGCTRNRRNKPLIVAYYTIPTNPVMSAEWSRANTSHQLLAFRAVDNARANSPYLGTCSMTGLKRRAFQTTACYMKAILAACQPGCRMPKASGARVVLVHVTVKMRVTGRIAANLCMR